MGHEGDHLRQDHTGLDARWIKQAQQLGTGHAVLQVIDSIPESHHVIVLYGDVPLITDLTLATLVEAADRQTGFSLLTSRLEDPTGYGRIVRDDAGNILRIVEGEGCKRPGKTAMRDQYGHDGSTRRPDEKMAGHVDR